MSKLFNSMPGTLMPIKEISQSLTSLWKKQFEESHQCRASQMNLILHFGLGMPEDLALNYFQSTLNLSERFPARILALCPFDYDADNTHFLDAKLCTQCTSDPSSIREAITLGYTISDTKYLEYQLTLWLDNDLPTYYWINHLPNDVVEQKYLPITKFTTKTFFDSKLEQGSYNQIQWPQPKKIADLSWYRTFPIRQSLGQYLSAFTCQEITQNLQNINVAYNSSHKYQAIQLLDWLQSAVYNCSDKDLNIEHTLTQDNSQNLSIHLNYSNNKYFHFLYNTTIANINANLNNEPLSNTLDIHPLNLQQTLEAAIFY